MASLRKEIVIDAPAAEVWSVLRDFGAVHTRLAPGFVTDTRLEGDSRWVSFSNGLVVREMLLDMDDEARRVAYSVVQGRTTHHHASMQVFAEGDERCRLVWIADFLPNDLTESMDWMMTHGAAVMKKTLETQQAPAGR